MYVTLSLATVTRMCTWPRTQGLPIAASSPCPKSGCCFQIEDPNLSASSVSQTDGRVLLLCATPTMSNLSNPKTPRCSLSPCHSSRHRQRLLRLPLVTGCNLLLCFLPDYRQQPTIVIPQQRSSAFVKEQKRHESIGHRPKHRYRAYLIWTLVASLKQKSRSSWPYSAVFVLMLWVEGEQVQLISV